MTVFFLFGFFLEEEAGTHVSDHFSLNPVYITSVAATISFIMKKDFPLMAQKNLITFYLSKCLIPYNPTLLKWGS